MIETARSQSKELGIGLKEYITEAIKKLNAEYETIDEKLENAVRKIVGDYTEGATIGINELEVAEKLVTDYGFTVMEVQSANLKEDKQKTWVLCKEDKNKRTGNQAALS